VKCAATWQINNVLFDTCPSQQHTLAPLMITRPLNEQIGDDNALRIHLLAEAARALRISGRASNYYLRELADCLDSGLFLAAIHLAVSLVEIHVRDLLVYFIASEQSSGDQVKWREALHNAEKKIEGVAKRGLSFSEILEKLVAANVVSKTDQEKLKGFYTSFRNPIQHGLSRRLVHGEGNEDLAFLAPLLESPERRSDELDEFVTHQAEELATFVVNFVKQRAKLTRNPGETASKFDHPWLCHTPPFERGVILECFAWKPSARFAVDITWARRALAPLPVPLISREIRSRST